MANEPARHVRTAEEVRGGGGTYCHKPGASDAVDLLLKGLSPYDVAKLLGDTIATVENHYTPFVRELRERARKAMETAEGLEKLGTNWAQSEVAEESIH